MATGTSFTFDNTSVFYGVIYNPDGDVLFNNYTEYYGMVVGNDVELSNATSVGFDLALLDQLRRLTGEYFLASVSEERVH